MGCHGLACMGCMGWLEWAVMWRIPLVGIVCVNSLAPARCGGPCVQSLNYYQTERVSRLFPDSMRIRASHWLCCCITDCLQLARVAQRLTRQQPR